MKVKEDIIKNGFSVGQVLELRETITPRKIKMFAHATGDKNPIHLSETFANTTLFKHRIAHGMLSASYISKLIGTELPGTIYMGQELHFRRPVYIGDVLNVTAKIIEYENDKDILTLETTVINQDNKIVIDGKAVVLVRGVRHLLANMIRE